MTLYEGEYVVPEAQWFSWMSLKCVPILNSSLDSETGTKVSYVTQNWTQVEEQDTGYEFRNLSQSFIAKWKVEHSWGRMVHTVLLKNGKS